MKQLVASIMTADQMNLDTEVNNLIESGIDWLHCDVMDGVFVNNLAMGPYQIEALKKYPELTLDIHLATVSPEKYIKMFGPLNPDYITFHIETTDNPEACIELIKQYNSKVGLAISPETPFESVKPYLKNIDLLLVMTVNPGFAGQQFNTAVFDKLAEMTAYFKDKTTRPLIQVDGNIHKETMAKMRDYDVDLFVLGTSALFNNKAGNYKEKATDLLSTQKETD